MLTIEKIKDASRVLSSTVRKTDLIHSPALSDGCEVYIKSENLQVTGSFKVRGASYKIANLSEEEKKQGVIACSAGNHAQGVALAAKKYGIRATICIPEGAPMSKVAATRSYGADVVLVKGVYDDAYARARQLQQEENLTFVHPFDDEDVIAGQGTIGLEILEQLPDVDTVIVPIGGGGLISGVSYAIKQLKPSCKVYGVQAAGAPSMYNSIHHRAIEELDSVSTIADGIAVKKPGELTFDCCTKYVDEIITVTDDEIATAILTLMEKQKMISEGAGATTVAAVLFHKLNLRGKKVVCLVSGGNIDVNILSRVVNKGLAKSGRLLEFTTEVLDKPGQLMRLMNLISDSGANIMSINHDRNNPDTPVGKCVVDFVVETQNQEHADHLLESLRHNGYPVE